MKKEDKFIGSAKIGTKGQIVIPKEIRDMFDLQTGDNIILLADKKRGIAMHKADFFHKISEDLMKGTSKASKEERELAEYIETLETEEID